MPAADDKAEKQKKNKETDQIARRDAQDGYPLEDIDDSRIQGPAKDGDRPVDEAVAEYHQDCQEKKT
jgi:hypothetical protein